MASGAGIVVLRFSAFEYAEQRRRDDARASSDAKHAAREPPPADQLVPLRSRESKRSCGVLHAPCSVPCGANARGTVSGARRLALLYVHRLLSSRWVAFCAGYAVRRPRVPGRSQLSAELPVWLTGVSRLCSLGLDPAAASPKAPCAGASCWWGRRRHRRVVRCCRYRVCIRPRGWHSRAGIQPSTRAACAGVWSVQGRNSGRYPGVVSAAALQDVCLG